MSVAIEVLEKRKAELVEELGRYWNSFISAEESLELAEKNLEGVRQNYNDVEDDVAVIINALKLLGEGEQ